MDKKTEQQEAHNNPEETTEEVVVEETVKEETPAIESTDGVAISRAELEDLRKKAEVSSQNFERLKKAEAKLKEFDLQDNEVLSEEDEDTAELKEKLSSIERKLEESDIQKANPILSECWDEFISYRDDPENQGMPMKTAAKAFIAEKGLNTQSRKGLEKVTGGTKVPQKSGMTAEEVKKLRETDYNKYRDMLKKGQIKWS